MTRPRRAPVAHRPAAVLALLGAASIAATAADAAGTHSDGHGPAMAHGGPGKPGDADRTIEVVMTDNAYDVDAIEVEAGETVRFVVHNRGRLVHEFNIGTTGMHGEHQSQMLEMMRTGAMTPTTIHRGSGHGAMAHAHANAVLLGPGESGELVWRFGPPREGLEFACNVPGHYQAGMRGAIHIDI